MNLPLDTKQHKENAAHNRKSTAPLSLDLDEYRGDLAEFDMSDEQKDEMLRTLWNIMSAFVDLGWGLDTVQLFSESRSNRFDRDSTSEVKPEAIAHEFQRAVKPANDERQNNA